MPDLGSLPFTKRVTVEDLLRILRDGRHPDGRRLGAALAARLRKFAARVGGVEGRAAQQSLPPRGRA